MDTGFIAAAIKRIARRKIVPQVVILAAIFISALGFLVILWLLGVKTMGFYLAVIVGASIPCAILARNVIILNGALQGPLESYFVSGLKRFGPLPPTIAQIYDEARAYLGTMGSFVTEHWIISATLNSLTFTRLEDVVWVYKQVIETKVNYGYLVTVSTGKTYAARIWIRSGACTTILSSEEGVIRLLDAIIINAPWVSRGYLDYLAALWASKQEEFIAAVDQRRKQSLFLQEDRAVVGNDEREIETEGIDQPALKPPPIGRGRRFEYDLNHPLVRAGLEEYNRKEDRNIRWKGLLLLFVGIVGSAMCILPVMLGIPRSNSRDFISKGIMISLIFLVLGIYNTAYGLKGKKFYRKIINIIGKNRRTLIFSIILITVGVILLSYAIDYIAKVFG